MRCGGDNAERFYLASQASWRSSRTKKCTVSASCCIRDFCSERIVAHPAVSTRQLLRSKLQHLAGYRLPPVTAKLTLVANSFRVHLEPVDWGFLVRTRRMPSSEQGLCRHLKPNSEFATSVNVGFRLSRRAPDPHLYLFHKMSVTIQRESLPWVCHVLSAKALKPVQQFSVLLP